MSALAELNLKLYNYFKRRNELIFKLNEIKLVKKQYNSVKSNISSLNTSVNVFEKSSALEINRPLAAGNSGYRVENIMHTISSNFEGNEFSSQVEQLNSDVDSAYSELINKENEIINKIEILNAETESLERQIEEEEAREAEEKKYEFEAKKADRL